MRENRKRNCPAREFRSFGVNAPKREDPYEMLGISPPETEEENAEGVPYKNIKILFTMNKYYKGVRRVTLTFNKHTG